MSNINILESVKSNPRYRMKSYTMTIILVALIIGFILLVGIFGPDFFALFIFLLIMAIPVILLLRDKLINVLPEFLSSRLIEIDHSEEEKNKVAFNPSKYTKQVGLYIIVSILLIGGGIFLNKGNELLKEYKSIYKILGGLVCVVMAGSILLEIDYIE